MAYGFINDGETIDHTVASTAAVAWEFRLTGAVVACLLDAGAVGAIVPAAIRGRYKCPSETGVAWAAGDKLYWDNTNKLFTKTSAGNTAAGHAAAVKGSAAATGEIVLHPVL